MTKMVLTNGVRQLKNYPTSLEYHLCSVVMYLSHNIVRLVGSLSFFSHSQFLGEVQSSPSEEPQKPDKKTAVA